MEINKQQTLNNVAKLIYHEIIELKKATVTLCNLMGYQQDTVLQDENVIEY